MPLSFCEHLSDILHNKRAFYFEIKWMIGITAMMYQHYQHIIIFCSHL